MEEELKYEITVGELEIKRPNSPEPSNYYDILEGEEERKERIFLYSEVVE